jgi:hypothetical protein
MTSQHVKWPAINAVLRLDRTCRVAVTEQYPSLLSAIVVVCSTHLSRIHFCVLSLFSLPSLSQLLVTWDMKVKEEANKADAFAAAAKELRMRVSDMEGKLAHQEKTVTVLTQDKESLEAEIARKNGMLAREGLGCYFVAICRVYFIG